MKKVTSFVGRNVKKGRNVKIWNFAYIGDDTRIGDNVVIGSLAHIDYKVTIGNNVRIEGMAYIPPMCRIGNDVFVGPCAVLTNDPYPPSKKLAGVIVEDGAVICAGARIGAGLRVGKRSVVAMGAVVTKDVPPGTVVMGVPARPAYDRKTYERKRKEWEAGR
ncbi:MAG: acyltransferase [Nitrososphaerales archaeon]